MPLNNHSCYSFKYGIPSPKRLLEAAQAQGYSMLALTDINNTSGCLNFLRLAPNMGIRPVVGIDFRNDQEQLYIGLAKTNRGFKQLNDYLSAHLTQDRPPFEKEAPMLEDVILIYPWDNMPERPLRPNEYIGISATQLNLSLIHI